jgi:hypothetical protein
MDECIECGDWNPQSCMQECYQCGKHVCDRCSMRHTLECEDEAFYQENDDL